MGASNATLENAKRLSHPASRAIISGQQAGVLSGPSFTFYKAHTAIKLSEEYSTEELPVVPVFWVASQDHDTAEIQSVKILDLEEKIRELSLEFPPSTPAGKIPSAPYAEALNQFLNAIGGNKKIQAKIAGDYGYTIAESFAHILLEFFGPYGLVVLDPMAPELAPLFLPVIERELRNPLASSALINQTAQEMHEAGLQTVLGRPEFATNLFLEGDDLQRRLLRVSGDGLSDGLEQYSAEALIEILKSHPERITPAAGLRPIAQDCVVPTVAFVVGPGEAKYVAELGGVYKLHGIEQPAVVLRLRVLVLEPPIFRIVQQYKIDPWKFQSNPEQCFRNAIAPSENASLEIDQYLKTVEESFTQIESRLSDQNLERPLRRAKFRIAHEITRLQTKLLTSKINQDSTLKSHYDRLKLHLLPGGKPQERVFPFVQYLLKHGPSVMEELHKLPATGEVVLELE